MDENTINYFNNSGDGFLMEEFMSEDSECNEITSATHNVGVVKVPSTKKYGHKNMDDADEESNETEYPSCSKERKRRIVWSKNAETFLLDLWEKYFVELRSVRKNAHIYSKIADQLKQKSGHKFSGHEVKIKIQNVQSKYLDERKKMGLSGSTSSTWVHFSKVHSIVGDYKSLNVVPSVKDAESSYQDTNPYNSDHEFQSPSFRSEPRKKKKVTDKQEELISITDTTNRLLKEDVVIKNKRTINSKNQTALLEEEYLIDEFLSDNSESSEPTESADEESNETEYPSCSKERKRRIVWTKYAERLLLELWDKNVAELRSERKNSHVYREITDQLITNGHKFSSHEVKTKIQNLHTKYNDEKKRLEAFDSTPSAWMHYSKVHSILERQNLTPLVKKSTGENQDTSLQSSHHGISSASIRAESRNKKKVRDQQEELINALNKANSIAEKDLVLKEKDILNSKKQTALIEQQIDILQGIAASTEQFQANILKLFKKK